MSLLRKPTPLKTAAPVKEAPVTKATQRAKEVEAPAPALATPVVQTFALPKAAESILSVTRTKIVNGEPAEKSDTEDTLDVRTFATEPARVSYTASVKKSDGDYGSVSASVTLTVPCYVEEVAEVSAQVREFVLARLDADAELMGINDGEDTAVVQESAEVEEESLDEASVDSADDEEGGYTAEDIRNMTKAEMVEVIKENNLDISTRLKEDTMREQLLALISDEPEADGTEEDAEEELTDEVTEDEPYTEEELKGAPLNDLVSLVKEYGIPVKLTKGMTDAQRKKAHIDAILEYQDSGE